MSSVHLTERRKRERRDRDRIGMGGPKRMSHLTRILNRTKTAFDSADADDKSEPTPE